MRKILISISIVFPVLLSACSTEPRKPFGEDCPRISASLLESLAHIRNLESRESKSAVLKGLKKNEDFVQGLIESRTFTKLEGETLSNIVLLHQAWISLIGERYPNVVDAWQIKGMSSLADVQTQAQTMCLKTLD